jgi:hypothetical protein
MSADLLEVQGLRAAHGQLVAVRYLGFSIARGDQLSMRRAQALHFEQVCAHAATPPR